MAGTVVAWFKGLDALFEKYHFQDWAVWNADEKTITITSKGHKVFTFEDNPVYEVVVENQTLHRHYTLLATTSAAGDLTLPTILVPLKNEPTEAIPFLGQINFLYTGSGYINKTSLAQWAAEIFIPKVTTLRAIHKTPDAPILLIMDNHSSRCDFAFAQLLSAANVVLYMLPSNTSFVLQPLDLNFNNTFQAYFNKYMPTLPAGFSMSEERKAVFGAILAAFRQASTPMTVKAGFKRSGIWTFEGKQDVAEPLSSACVIPGPYEPPAPLSGGQPDIRAKVITTEEFLAELRAWEQK